MKGGEREREENLQLPKTEKYQNSKYMTWLHPVLMLWCVYVFVCWGNTLGSSVNLRLEVYFSFYFLNAEV